MSKPSLNNLELNNLILASLLHDIGKFIQRTKEFTEKHEQISQFFANVLTIKNFLPNRKIIDVDLINQLIGTTHRRERNEVKELNDKEESQMIKKLKEIIRKSDHFSANTERSILAIENFDPSEVNIKPIFNYYPKTAVEKHFFYHISSIYDFSDEKFLPESSITVETNIQSYGHLLSPSDLGRYLKQFQKIASKFDYFPFFLFIEEMFQYFFTRIPDDRRDSKLLSNLFDHSRLTALYSHLLYFNDNGDYYFLRFDFEGIQRFIFDVKTKKASRILRGRSLFIQVLTEILAYVFLKEFGYYPHNLISSAGGNITIIIPKDRKREEIENFFEKKAQAILSLFNLNLRLTLSEGSMFKIDNLKNFLSNARPKPLKNLIFRLTDIVDQRLYLNFTDAESCQFCEKEKGVFEIQGEGKACHLCFLGYKLSDVVSKDRGLFFVGQSKDLLGVTIFDDYQIFFDKTLVNRFQLLTAFRSIRAFENKKQELVSYPVKTIYYQADLPEKAGQVMTFEEMNESGYLAVAKGDLDDFGVIINQIYHKKTEELFGEKYLFSRFLHLSRQTNLFFQNYMVKKAKEKNLYLVFSGGDDFILIGDWQKVFEFVFDFFAFQNSPFKKFFCENPNIHLSIGVELFKETTPILSVIENAEEHLHQAKEVEGKGSMSFLHSVAKLEEWLKIDELSKKIDPYDEEDKPLISTSFFYKIYQIADYFKEPKAHYDKANSVFKIFYYFKRQDYDDSDQRLESFIDFFNKISQMPPSSDQNFEYQHLKTIINLILLRRRKKGGEGR